FVPSRVHGDRASWPPIAKSRAPVRPSYTSPPAATALPSALNDTGGGASSGNAVIVVAIALPVLRDVIRSARQPFSGFGRHREKSGSFSICAIAAMADSSGLTEKGGGRSLLGAIGTLARTAPVRGSQTSRVLPSPPKLAAMRKLPRGVHPMAIAIGSRL